MFEEQLPGHAIDELYRQMDKPFDLVMTIGTSSYFPYIIAPVERASEAGIPTVEINPSETCVSNLVDVKLPLRAAESLNEIWRRYLAAS